MAEGMLAKLTRQFRQQVLPTFQRKSLLSLFPAENIGGIDITRWAIKNMKPLSKPSVVEQGMGWQAEEDKMDAESYDLAIYDFQKRVTMSREERAAFEKNGILTQGYDEIGSQMAQETNYWLFRGKRAEQKFNPTQYNYVTAHQASATAYSNPSLITAASAGKWDAATIAQTDIATLLSNLETYGFDIATTVLFYPEVVALGFRRPIVTATSTNGPISVAEYALQQGIAGIVPVKDELLYTAAGANPTVNAFDIYAIDMSKVRIGYVKPESVEVIDDRISKNTMLDAELVFAPLFMSKEYDTDGYIYKGVSRITACDLST